MGEFLCTEVPRCLSIVRQPATALLDAGGLMIEHPLVAPLISTIEGTRDSIMGLPQRLVLEGLLAASDTLPSHLD